MIPTALALPMWSVLLCGTAADFGKPVAVQPTIAIPLVSILNPEHVLEKVSGVFWMNPYLASSHPAQF